MDGKRQYATLFDVAKSICAIFEMILTSGPGAAREASQEPSKVPGVKASRQHNGAFLERRRIDANAFQMACNLTLQPLQAFYMFGFRAGNQNCLCV